MQNGERGEVLAQFGGTSRPFILLYPQVRHMPLRVRVFVDFLLRHQDLARTGKAEPQARAIEAWPPAA
ncbi:hypothetical protein [Pseudomonas piscis]|uniref:hypothetical protein n=1 Tax=Pseudomonas piscis TaxID=2614538 RepID=UPI0021D5EE86|nr:hypothetical protein [Pseudomonas piscis]MCU7645860.1 hypothetical protein [Pseudomonas piscis]